MAFNLGSSNNSGKLHISDFLNSGTQVQNTEKDIPIEQLVPWENQPFKMYGEFKMNELVESIKENGLLSRIIVCPIDGGKYRIIAGHNRVEACRRAGFTAVPSVIKNVDENRAKLIIAVVIGGLLMAGLVALFNNVIMPRVETEVTGLFDAAG